MTGTPLYAKKRFQFSFPMHKVNKIDISQNLPTVLLPFIWVEEGIELPDFLITKLNNELFRVLKFLDVVRWLITILGAGIVSGGVGLYYKEKYAPPVKPDSGISQKSETLGDKGTQSHEMGHTNFGYLN